VRSLLAGGIDAREAHPLVVRVEATVISKIKIVTRHSRQLLLKRNAESVKPFLKKVFLVDPFH